MSSLRVLHLASFEGNMGDILNHTHTRQQLAKTFDFQYTNLEIRDYYWGKRKWNDFPQIANDYDLVMIGGGNFFELWPATRTSTSIDLPPELLKRIHKPILFYGLGVDDGQGIYAESRFKALLDYIEETPNRMLVVRNDGSRETVQKLFHVEPLEVPDGGFYYRCDRPKHNHWAINVANDMPEHRRNWPLKALPGFLDNQLEKNPGLHLVFIPHIYKDLEPINHILNNMNDRHVRRQVSVAPHNMGDMFLMYKCHLTLATRFHANVASLAVGTPTIALNTYPQIVKTFNGLGLDVANSRSDLERMSQGFRQEYNLPSILEVHGKIREWLTWKQ